MKNTSLKDVAVFPLIVLAIFAFNLIAASAELRLAAPSGTLQHVFETTRLDVPKPIYTLAQQEIPQQETPQQETASIYTVSNIAFHDFNGNGYRDIGEPVLQGIIFTFQPEGAICTTDASGKCNTHVPAGTYLVFVNDPSGEKRYIASDVHSFQETTQPISVKVPNEKEVNAALMNGFLVIPFLRNTSHSIIEYFDYDPRLYAFLYWNGKKGRGYERNHTGTDFAVDRNGIPVVASAPGRVIWMRIDPNGGEAVDFQTPTKLKFKISHIKREPWLKVGSIVYRGQVIGTVDFPRGPPHVHLQVQERKKGGNYVLDTFKPSISHCGGWLHSDSGELTFEKGPCSPGYWTDTNNPKFP